MGGVSSVGMLTGNKGDRQNVGSTSGSVGKVHVSAYHQTRHTSDVAVSDYERNPPRRGQNPDESQTALNWMERQLIPSDIETRAKGAVDRVTGGSLSEDEVSKIYDSIERNISLSEAKEFGGINPNAATINLNDAQCKIVKAQIDALEPALRKKASGAFEKAQADGKVHCR